MDLMTLGCEFQSAEGLVVVSDSESDKEVYASASLGPAPPASPVEPGSPKLADGVGLEKQTTAAGLEPFDPFTSRAFGQPLTCRHAKEPHEFRGTVWAYVRLDVGDLSKGVGFVAGVSCAMRKGCKGAFVTSSCPSWMMLRLCPSSLQPAASSRHPSNPNPCSDYGRSLPP